MRSRRNIRRQPLADPQKCSALCPYVNFSWPQEDHCSTAMEIVEAKDLGQLTDLDEIESLCRGIVQDPQHAKQVDTYSVPDLRHLLCGVFLGSRAPARRADDKPLLRPLPFPLLLLAMPSTGVGCILLPAGFQAATTDNAPLSPFPRRFF